MLDRADGEALVLDDGVVRPEHSRDAGLASLLEGIGGHCAYSAASHQEDIGFAQ